MQQAICLIRTLSGHLETASHSSSLTPCVGKNGGILFLTYWTAIHGNASLHFRCKATAVKLLETADSVKPFVQQDNPRIGNNFLLHPLKSQQKAFLDKNI